MQVTLPPMDCSFTSFSEKDYRKFEYLLQQGRPLFLDNATIRQATWWEMVNPWNGRNEQNRRITELFHKHVVQRQKCQPRANRKSWVMQCANLWSKQIKDKELRAAYATDLLYMKLGIDPKGSDFAKNRNNFEFPKWAHKHHQHHFFGFFNTQVKYSEIGKDIMLPFVTAEGTEYRKWVDVKDDKSIFSPHPKYGIDGEWASIHLGQYGYDKGSWPNDPRPEDQSKLEDWATWDAYKKSLKQSWGKVDAIEIDLWMTPKALLDKSHFLVRLLRKDGWKYSAGEYRPKSYHPVKRPDGWSLAKGAITYKERMERPDDSTFQWSAPTMLQKFRFVAPEGLPEQMMENMKAALIEDKMYYQGPELICQQIYERLLGRKFDFRMSLWKVFSDHAQHNYGVKLASYIPDPIRNGCAFVGSGIHKVKDGISYFIPEFLSNACEKVGGAAVAPIENIIASFIGATKVADDAKDFAPGPGVTWRNMFTRRQQPSHPYVAYHLLMKKCEEYADKVRDQLVTPPECHSDADLKEWLSTDIHKRLHPYDILESISTPATGCAT